MFDGSQYVYYGMYLVGFAIMMILNIKDCGRYKIEKKNAVIYTLYTYVAGVVGAMLMGKIYTAVAQAVGINYTGRVAIFGAVMFTPIILVIIFMLSKSDVRRNMDMLTPGIFIILACAKFGCFFSGCCAGFVWEHGIYNPAIDEKVFPVQIFEVVTMIAVIVLTQLYFKKSKRYVKGTAYPITAAVYSVTRFLWEEARYYSSDRMKNLFLGLSLWQICCIIVFVVSVILIVILHSDKVKQMDIAKEKAIEQMEKEAKLEKAKKKKRKKKKA
ncbi:MAG: prolipoprotein diacylglyceryl transferase [Faecalibacterium sp.]|nr:prolipoprotein diacylglyceryl transferase [Ruminococcus sp.]MCM1391547.1 prolipoprotein diacylglyceryl transferase [Ruminococcus sp.]MCM1485490.1 prolipoprotein diacylglyceryl transferase [Faecalibacterium sp.]